MVPHCPLDYMEQLGEHFKLDLCVILELTGFFEVIYPSPTPPLPHTITWLPLVIL